MAFRQLRPHAGRGYVPLIAALLGSTVIILSVTYFFLVPALNAMHGANPAERKLLATNAWLVLIVVLFVLLVIFSVSFRVSRMFFRPPEKRTTTKYSDAWAESARRFQMPPDEIDPGDDPPDLAQR